MVKIVPPEEAKEVFDKDKKKTATKKPPYIDNRVVQAVNRFIVDNPDISYIKPNWYKRGSLMSTSSIERLVYNACILTITEAEKEWSNYGFEPTPLLLTKTITSLNSKTVPVGLPTLEESDHDYRYAAWNKETGEVYPCSIPYRNKFFIYDPATLEFEEIPYSKVFTCQRLLVEWKEGLEDTPTPTWDAAIEHWSNDEEDVAEYLQVLVGQAILNHAPNAVWAIFEGTGALGKSTYVEVCKAILGYSNYATSTLLQLGGRFALSGLAGKRILLMREMSTGGRDVASLTRAALDVIKILVEDSSSSQPAAMAEQKNVDSAHAVPINRMSVWSEINNIPNLMVKVNERVSMERRTSVVKFSKPVEGGRDTSLSAKLEEERDAIAAKCVKSNQNQTCLLYTSPSPRD